jgi:hypothetical protein
MHSRDTAGVADRVAPVPTDVVAIASSPLSLPRSSSTSSSSLPSPHARLDNLSQRSETPSSGSSLSTRQAQPARTYSLWSNVSANLPVFRRAGIDEEEGEDERGYEGTHLADRSESRRIDRDRAVRGSISGAAEELRDAFASVSVTPAAASSTLELTSRVIGAGGISGAYPHPPTISQLSPLIASPPASASTNPSPTSVITLDSAASSPKVRHVGFVSSLSNLRARSRSRTRIGLLGKSKGRTNEIVIVDTSKNGLVENWERVSRVYSYKFHLSFHMVSDICTFYFLFALHPLEGLDWTRWLRKYSAFLLKTFAYSFPRFECNIHVVGLAVK